MTMRPFFEWCDHLAVANAIRDSRFAFPIIETLHLLALTVLLGTVLVLALRLMGAGLKKQPVAVVGRALAPLTNWSLAVMLVSGFLMFTSEAMKCYENPPFFFKMAMLTVSIVFHYTLVRPLVATDQAPGRGRAFFTGIVSILTWFSVAAGGRAIGFY